MNNHNLRLGSEVFSAILCSSSVTLVTGSDENDSGSGSPSMASRDKEYVAGSILPWKRYVFPIVKCDYSTTIQLTIIKFS